MVAINQIVKLNENVTAFELDAGDRALWNGIQAEWRGASFIAKNTSSEYPDIRRNQPIPKSYRGAFVNAAREAKGLPRLNFDGAGNLRPGATTAPNTNTNTTPAAPAAQKPPLELDDLTNGQKRGLNRTGRINYGGFVYTRAEVNAFTQAAAARRAQAGRDARATIFDAKSKDDIIKNRSFLKGATARAMRGILPGFGLSIGVQAGGWLALRGYLVDINEAAYRTMKANPSMSDEEIQTLLDQTNLASQRLLGMWFAVTAAPEILVAAVKGTAAVVRLIKDPLRVWNATSMAVQQAVSAFTGPGFIVMLGKNALQWALVEGGLAALTFLLARNAWVQEMVLQSIKGEWTAWVADQGYRGASATNAAIESAWNYAASDKINAPIDPVTQVDVLKRIYLDEPRLAQSLIQDNPELVSELPQEVQRAIRGVFVDGNNDDSNDDTAPQTQPRSDGEPSGVIPNPLN